MGLCRRKCSPSSIAIPHKQTGFRQLKLCLNLCSHRTLNYGRNFDKCLTHTTSFMPQIGFFSGRLIAINLRLNSETLSFLFNQILNVTLGSIVIHRKYAGFSMNKLATYRSVVKFFKFFHQNHFQNFRVRYCNYRCF